MSQLLTLFAPTGGGAGADDPSAIDSANLNLLLLDGDLELGSGNWKNQVGDKANMVFGVSGVTVDATGLNGHGIMKTIGGHIGSTAGGATITTPVIPKSTAITTYIVYRVVAHVGNKRLISEGTDSTHGYVCSSSAMSVAKDGSSVPSPQAVTAGKWVIDSWTHKGFNGANNCQRTQYVEDATTVRGILRRIGETTDIEGYTLGRDTLYFSQLECDFAYMMVYSGEHDNDTQDSIFAAFRLRFGI